MRAARTARAAALVSALACTGPAAACEAPGAGYVRLESPRFVVWLAADPRNPAVGREFALEARVCGKSGTAPAAVRFDAWMPAHRHGMNTRPSLERRGADRYRAEGFLFHMPGAWQYTVEIDTAAGRERLTHDHSVD